MPIFFAPNVDRKSTLNESEVKAMYNKHRQRSHKTYKKRQAQMNRYSGGYHMSTKDKLESSWLFRLLSRKK